ncbi:plasmid stabilization protein [soil metagenome]
MSTLTVRNLDPEIVEALKLRGASNGRSMEAEARSILAAVLGPDARLGLGSRIRDRFAGLDFEVPERNRELPRVVDFDDR